MMNSIKSAIRHFALFSVVNLQYYWWFYFFISLGLVFSLSLVSYFQILGQPGVLNLLINDAFWIFMNMGLAITAASGLGLYANSKARVHLLTTPVSNTMRLISLLVYTVLLPFVIFALIYTVTANVIARFSTLLDYTDAFSFSPFGLKDVGWKFIFLIAFQLLLLLVGSFFRKVAVIKTGLTLICLFLVIMLIDTITAGYTIDKSMIWNVFGLFGSEMNSSRELLFELPWYFKFINFLACVSFVPVSLYIVYLRIKELEA